MMRYKFVMGILVSWWVSASAQPDTLWTKTFGGNDSDYGHSVQQTSDGGYIITGATKSYGAGGYDVWLIKTDRSGDTLWTKTFGGSGDDWGNSVQQTSDGGYIIAGATGSYSAGGYDVWLIKTAPEAGVKEYSEARVQKTKLLKVQPNPFSTWITIQGAGLGPDGGSLTIYDASGKLVRSFTIPSSQFTVVWDGRDWSGHKMSGGVYFACLESSGVKVLKKLTLLR